MGFQDAFSAVSAAYRSYRPRYPLELLEWLASIAPGRALAWDVGTGNGQCAVDLARLFERIVATDASQQQIANAVPADGVEYRVALAQDSGLPASSVQLVTVAQAVQWFDLDAFYADVRRVIRPGGVVAVWCYNMARISPEIDAVLHAFEHETLKPFWPPVIAYVNAGYRNLPFPFNEIAPPPPFVAQADWTLADLLGHLSSMSASARFWAARGHDPIDEIREQLAAAWGTAEVARRIVWPLRLRVGRI